MFLGLTLALKAHKMDLILPNLDPHETFSKWFKANPNTRPDGRTLEDLPEISFQFGTMRFTIAHALLTST